jgi:hypothetical protein
MQSKQHSQLSSQRKQQHSVARLRRKSISEPDDIFDQQQQQQQNVPGAQASSVLALSLWGRGRGLLVLHRLLLGNNHNQFAVGQQSITDEFRTW